ncbi:hypothetical protein [Chitinophaga sp. S165]|uniref:hypothetical protein n=1 Tax=Chitinophaga sp. S165 TaxID=2135462 RepID=UPI000D709E66|nr:hypothetical protein [Chitinophaga sp. S165]PWV47122.1 hypothetical protein C7475_109210 [Chitinophaga sp. S165]
MLEGITWGNFAVFMVAALVLYFIVLIVTGQLKFRYKVEKGDGTAVPVKKFWKVEEQPAVVTGQLPALQGMDIHELDSERSTSNIDKDFAALESLAVELQEICADAGPTTTKEVLSDQMRQQIAAYPTLNTIAFKGAISNLIVKAAAVDCNITFTIAEAEALWQ